VQGFPKLGGFMHIKQSYFRSIVQHFFEVDCANGFWQYGCHVIFHTLI
jgi:hypothetical protein